MANIKKLPLFVRCVIQNFPFIEEDFDALTNYQLISKVVEFLNKVINSQNEVIDATNELSEAFQLLHDYVENYFDNLDVQEEINNKLDDMVEAGTLQEIISEYLNSSCVWGFDSVADMQAATNLIDGSYAKTLGYYEANDGGSGNYKIRAKTEADTPDGMLLIAIGDTLVAELIVDTEINSKQCGLKGDGTTDETTKLNTFFALPTTYNKTLNKGLYITTGPVFIKGRWSDTNPTQYVIKFDQATIKYTGSANGASVVFFDHKHSVIEGLNVATNSNANYVQLTGCWYSAFNNGVIKNLTLTTDTTLISTYGYSSPASMYVSINNFRLWHGKLSINNNSGSYINSITFNNTLFDGHDNTYAVEFNGATSHQNIRFASCDLSYATGAIFNIVDALTANGYIVCENCYFDSAIPMFKDNNPNNLNVKLYGCINASNNSSLPLNYDKRVLIENNSGYFVDGDNRQSESVNYIVNGDMSTANDTGASGGDLMQQSNTYATKQFISSTLNANGRAREVEVIQIPGSGNFGINIRGINVPRAGHYACYIRMKVVSGTYTNLQLNNHSQYTTYTKDQIGNNEVLLISNKKASLSANDDSTFSLTFTSPQTGLKFEVYEAGVVLGSEYIPYAKLDSGAILS